MPLIVKHIAADQWLSTWIAVVFAEDVLHVFEDKHPNDMRPRSAIDAAKAWLSNPSTANADAAAAACAAARRLHRAGAYAAANAADAAAAYAAANAADAAAAYAAADAANAAVNAAYYAAAADAASAADKKVYIHNMLSKHLTFIINYHIDNNQSFGCIEEVFNAASDADKEKLLYKLGDTNA